MLSAVKFPLKTTLKVSIFTSNKSRQAIWTVLRHFNDFICHKCWKKVSAKAFRKQPFNQKTPFILKSFREFKENPSRRAKHVKQNQKKKIPLFVFFNYFSQKKKKKKIKINQEIRRRKISQTMKICFFLSSSHKNFIVWKFPSIKKLF